MQLEGGEGPYPNDKSLNPIRTGGEGAYMPPMSFMPTYIAIWLEHYSNVATWSMGFRSKKWGDEWVTVMTTTPTAVLKNDM